MNPFRDKRPLVGQDPFVVKMGGYLFLIESQNEERITVSYLINGERTGTEVIWDNPGERQVWAPEAHQIGAYWFIYYSASDGNNANHRMKVLCGSGLFGPYHLVNASLSEVWGIDMTTFTWEGQRYAIWSGWPYNGAEFPQNLYVASMPTPTEIGDPTLLSVPEFHWEKSIAPILEGPQIWHHNGKLRLLYSANASWTIHYATGMMELKIYGNPLNPGDWIKSSGPLALNAGHGMVLGDEFICHRKMSTMAGWSDREIVRYPLDTLI